MKPATSRFFDITELVTHLAQFLDYKGISRLMQTNRLLNTQCTPAHYCNISIAHTLSKRQLFSSAVSTQALARNIHHVRQFCSGAREVVFYINGIFAHLEKLLQQTINTTIERDLSPQQPCFQPLHPLWLAPPDPPIPILVPIPPMTMLTKLNIGIDCPGDYRSCRYHLPSFQDPKVILTYICWIMDSNPHLLDVSVDSLIIKDQRDVRLLTTSIFGLKNLQRLNLKPYQNYTWIWEIPSDLVLSFFFCCPPSLQSFEFGPIVEESVWNPSAELRYDESIQDLLYPWEKDEAECGVPATTPRRLEPLTNLRALGVTEDHISESYILSMLEHCPNLTDLAIPGLQAVKNEQDLAQDIAQLCPKLTGMQDLEESRNEYPDLIGQLLRVLPQQQVKKICCPNQKFVVDQDLGFAERLFRRHSTTLQSITLSSSENINSKTIQMILVECEALEELTVYQNPYENHLWLCLNLEDAIEFPWACNRIRTLELTVVVPDEPFHYLAENTVPYYDRPAPIVLSVAEKKQLKSLEALYRQIGALTELQTLDLQAVFFDLQGHRRGATHGYLNTLPGMLSLGCEETGRPGYLAHLAGLTKLKQLKGSFSAMTNETRVTVGMDEVVWMERHWPALESAEFSVHEDKMPESFLWWKERRAGKTFYIGA
ncbi:hypothetical protein BGX24_003116 [Mortierella sp. AD032]|nr:hypothetical protein BGX24_003116 [Mortierella sp. AD032]